MPLKLSNRDADDVGQFINLRAFCACKDFAGPDARLPNWKTIRKSYPDLIDPLDGEKARPLFITHRWDDPGHPDPSGWQLRALRALGYHYDYRSEHIAFWYDFMSLPQQPRTPAETVIFKKALSNIRNLVGACENVSLISQVGDNHQEDLAAMLTRGWVVAELYIARSRINISLPLYEREGEAKMVNYGRSRRGWDAVVPDLHAVAPLDSADTLHAWFGARGISCTNGSDLMFLSEQLHDELHRFDDDGPAPAVVFGSEMQLDDSEMIRLAIVDSSGISVRFPHLFAKESAWDPETGVWTVVFAHRPPPLEIDKPHVLADGELKARLIDTATLTSPMYPGVRFELSSDRKTFCARLA